MKRLLKLFLAIVLMATACTKDKDPVEPIELPDPNLHKQPVGESANDLLDGSKYEELTLEIVSVNGYELDDAVISSFKSFVEKLVNKPKGISVRTFSVSSPGMAPYSRQDIVDFENDKRTEFHQNDEITIFIFITDGAYTEEQVLGVAYRNTSFAIMGERIDELTGGLGQPNENLVLQTVMRHEMGHLLGLVNVGTEMQTDHQDIEHGHHCDVEGCLMYYSVETGDVITNLVGSSAPPELDSQCRADLRNNGGK